MGYSLPVYTYNHPIYQVVIELPLGMQPLRARAMMKNKKIGKEAASFAMLCNPRLMSLVYAQASKQPLQFEEYFDQHFHGQILVASRAVWEKFWKLVQANQIQAVGIEH